MTLVQTRGAAPPVRRNVPGRIRVISGITVAALALLFAALAVGSSSARDGLRVIGRDAGPQVVATAGLYLALSDMDAQVANMLVMGDQYTRQRAEALDQYERRRTEANQALLKAFELSGDNPAERRTVESVLDGLGRYERLAGQALLLDERSAHPPGPPPREVVQTYRSATDLMRLELLPQAYNLTLETGTIVRSTYDEKALMVPLVRGAVLVAGLIALGCLIWLQVFLARRFRRVFGPALLVATVTTAVSLFFGVNVLGQDEEALRTAKSAGFDSVLTLARARAISNSMQGDESRYLLDQERADTYEHTYLDKSLSVIYFDAGNLDAYHEKVAERSDDFLGLLGPELVGMEGEDVMAAYRDFQAADMTFRRLALDGRANDAVAARLGPVTSAFHSFDQAMVQLADRHQSVFTAAIDTGESALNNLWRLLPYAIGAIGLLVIAGVWPRLKEYR
ncbi:hypothetical protein [Nonomuraea jiangxiensis]|uniref:Secreted protein n=1 Tax=Nonomuraea jiangxiensis TaxID=633440 RepID=A0A1G7YY46_9ACTN|nr:hypothetical protein [Nonomuraea jiangxiensis]SDH00770.1 hypothetical protein SAMN05421869_101235 [Nonomuraea jiangxiensis]